MKKKNVKTKKTRDWPRPKNNKKAEKAGDWSCLDKNKNISRQKKYEHIHQLY